MGLFCGRNLCNVPRVHAAVHILTCSQEPGVYRVIFMEILHLVWLLHDGLVLKTFNSTTTTLYLFCTAKSHVRLDCFHLCDMDCFAKNLKFQHGEMITNALICSIKKTDPQFKLYLMLWSQSLHLSAQTSNKMNVSCAWYCHIKAELLCPHYHMHAHLKL